MLCHYLDRMLLQICWYQEAAVGVLVFHTYIGVIAPGPMYSIVGSLCSSRSHRSKLSHWVGCIGNSVGGPGGLKVLEHCRTGYVLFGTPPRGYGTGMRPKSKIYSEMCEKLSHIPWPPQLITACNRISTIIIPKIMENTKQRISLRSIH